MPGARRSPPIILNEEVLLVDLVLVLGCVDDVGQRWALVRVRVVRLVKLLLIGEGLPLRHVLVEILVKEALAAILRVRPLPVAHPLPFGALGARLDDSSRWARLQPTELVSALALVAGLDAAPVWRFLVEVVISFW